MVQEDRLYPICRLEKYSEPTTVYGIGSESQMETRYALVLRAEFVPINRVTGQEDYPTRDIYMKVLPKGKANVPGCLLGFPTLEVEPHGLGWRTCEKTHYFTELDVHLLRGELQRRAELHDEMAQ